MTTFAPEVDFGRSHIFGILKQDGLDGTYDPEETMVGRKVTQASTTFRRPILIPFTLESMGLKTMRSKYNAA